MFLISFFWLGYPRMCCLISTYCGFSSFLTLLIPGVTHSGQKKMCGLISIFLFCVTQRRYRSSIKLCGMCLRRMCVSLILGGMFWTVLLFMSSGSDIGLPIWKVYPLLRSHHWIFFFCSVFPSDSSVFTSHIGFSGAGCTQSYAFPLNWPFHHLILSLLLVKGFTLQSALSGVSVAILTVFGYRWQEISV